MPHSPLSMSQIVYIIELAATASQPPTLSSNGIKLVGIGLESLGVEDFVKNKYFAGDIYIDDKRKCYKDLNFKRYGVLGALKAVISSYSSKILAEARERNIEGNLKGDGLQNGGLLIVRKGGELIFLHREEFPGDFCTDETIIKALGITKTTEPPSVTEKWKK
ncbi:PREDICTED: prostamide/prostaglandin F synthase-like [Amphimedon queenslandica]|uniref:Peroxiredoxin-like 2 activated in M-CSF stimulated monocytes n=1 Tax=Amphimedon queenslandica TaxID=400682 RepID=A0AAN0JDX8_AMPQE|nr:PREDICTED: prostamide/prostaglandin F synthase-like [Amphimedon queenslandica]|eukprot:XP_019855199.1 PREDICTED: prostamide/prostaglandin F synthase-like [Amphimedon queenslandica]